MRTMYAKRFGPATLMTGAVAGFGLAIAVLAGSFSHAVPAMDEAEVKIGTYEPQRAFQQYHGMREFNEQAQRMQQEAQAAQQQGDHQRAMQLQQQMQQLQNEIVQKFYSEVEQAVPEVAETAGVKVVAIEIVYADPEFGEPEDITDPLISKVNENANAQDESQGESDTPR